MNPITHIRSTRTPRVQFYLERRRDKKSGEIIIENVPLLFSVSYGGRYKSSTGIRLDEKHWDEEGQRVRTSHTQAANINKQLKDLKKELEDICYKAWNNEVEEVITPEYISEKLKKHQKSARGFFYYFDLFIEKGDKRWAENTTKKFTTMKNHLEDFEKKTGYKVEFDRLNDAFFEKLLDYYFDDEDTGFINTYVRKNIRFLKQFLIWATDKGYNKNLAFRKWKLETGSKKETAQENIALTISEFMQIYNHPPSTKAMARAKDYLILSCGTGMRFSDIMSLKKTDIDYTARFIQTISEKTGDKIFLPFNEFSQEILEKYRHTDNFNESGVDMAFPTISNQKTNEALKALAKDAKLNAQVTLISYKRNKKNETVKSKHELVSTHIGRKTFITLNIALGVQSEITQKLTGHKSHAMMERYYSIDVGQRIEAMNLFSIENFKSKLTHSEISQN